LAEAVILVVDDHQPNVMLLQRMLERAGARHVVGSTDGIDAVRLYKDIRPDLVLLDLHMPNMDGIAALEAMRASDPPGSYVPVVVLTADGTLEARYKALAAGAKDYLTKPFEQSEVLLRVRNLLETRWLHVQVQMRNVALENELRQSLEGQHRQAEGYRQRLTRIEGVLETEDMEIIFQPIIDLTTSSVAGHEALARFSAEPMRPPNEWFAEAEEVGLGAQLEMLAVRSALSQLGQLPDRTYVSINVAPSTATHTELADLVEPYHDRVVVELTEHDQVDQYDQLRAALERMRQAGIRIAIDDAGSGYASLKHILRLNPDIIKLDIDLTRNIHRDRARRALAAALVAFAASIGASITAEGIETVDELDTVRELGISCGQGYYLGRPARL
jgi:EAL domain-containing protein (putative c-di-GMP-specific phosphodiesterase class I)/ActR/RegA family two-component response regulator